MEAPPALRAGAAVGDDQIGSGDLGITPGKRTEDGAKMGGCKDEQLSPPPRPDAKRKAPKLATGPA